MAAIIANACAPSDTLPDRPITIEVGGDHPNVLVVITDDQRARGTLGAMPQTVRWFREHGTRFTRAYATTPLCCPSRASIFTGRYAHNHGVTSNFDISPFDHEKTVQRALHDGGYRTAITGKFLNRWPIEASPPHFDLFAIFSPRVATRSYFGTTFNHNGDVERVDDYSTSFIHERAISFLDAFEEQDRAPWFMVVAPYAPHKPFDLPDEYASVNIPNFESVAEERNVDDKPRFVQDFDPPSTKRIEKVREGQYRTLLPVDDMMADIADSLERLEEDDATLAFFLSDNGYSWGEQNAEGKAIPYDPSVRIPLLVRWPSAHHPTTSRNIVGTIDIAPTILKAAGVRPVGLRSVDGRVLSRGKSRERLLLEYWANRRSAIPSWGSLITRHAQYIEYYGERGRMIAREYYDMRTDPQQRRNLLHGPSPTGLEVARFHRWLRLDRRCIGDRCP